MSGSTRQIGRKGPCRRLRSQGLVPGIVYGLGESVPVSVAAKDVLKILESKGGAHHIIKAKFDGDKKDRHVMIKQLDVHPISDKLLHIDLLEIDLNKPVRFPVDLEVSGVPIGVKEKGGRLKMNKSRVIVECLPKDIPDTIVVPVAGLDIGDGVKVSDLAVPANVTIMEDPDFVVITVIQPAAVEVTPVAAAAAPAAEAAKPAEAAAPAKGSAPSK